MALCVNQVRPAFYFVCLEFRALWGQIHGSLPRKASLFVCFTQKISVFWWPFYFIIIITKSISIRCMNSEVYNNLFFPEYILQNSPRYILCNINYMLFFIVFWKKLKKKNYNQASANLRPSHCILPSLSLLKSEFLLRIKLKILELKILSR